MTRQYDLAVIGSGPAGQKAAIQGAKLGKRVAIVDRSSCIGGICIHHGAIPSKSLREAILYFTGFYHRQTYGARHQKDLSMRELMERCAQVESNETKVVVDQLERNGVDFIEGEAAFENEHTLVVRDAERSFEIAAKVIIVATGTTPSRPPSVPFEDGVIVDSNGLTTLIPYGIYTVPEISMVGLNEKQLVKQEVPYEIGIARYREIARGQILGDRVGMLKLLFHQDTRQLLGIHAIGQGATELIHIGQMVMAFSGTIDYFIENTFNYPTLAECYRVAALNGFNKVMAAGQ